MNCTDTLAPQLASLHRELEIPPTYTFDRQLAPQPEATETDLVDVGLNPDGRLVQLTAAAAEAWSAMQGTAQRDGISLLAVSGFRSVARQAEIIRGKLNAGQPIASILRFIAAPGFSEHHTGDALDIGSPGNTTLEEEFATTPAYRWLELNAGKFGFSLSYPRGNSTGIGYEPWHWRFRVRLS